VWGELFPQGHTFELTRIFRQAEEPLVALLNDVRKGQLSQPSLKLLHSLARPLAMPAGIEPTLLFATNDKVDALNAQRLAQLPGPERVYDAEDAGQEPHLTQMRKNCLAEARLRLKEGAQVMLIKNLNVGMGLCNGAKGRVTGFTPPDDEGGNCGAGRQGWPIVQFANGVEQVRAGLDWMGGSLDYSFIHPSTP
jgi:ATP-dependent DNA helicase PIF1